MKKMKREPISDECLFFGEKLKQIRISHKLTQEELSKIMDVGKVTVLNYENGTRKVPITYLVKFAKHFKISVDGILGIKLSTVEELTEEERMEVQEFIKFLISKRKK
jgi:transcriptional regulator with XRE-family HTH domain